MNDILTPCILQTVIICCTIIILGLIGVSAYRVYVNDKRTWGSYIFSASVLLILAIAIFSFCFCGNRNVLDFISLASALISIILAVVTIIYSYFINSRSSGQIDQLNKAAQAVSKATLSYTESAESLQENIRKIIETVNNVEIKTDNIIGQLAKQQGNPAENKISDILKEDSSARSKSKQPDTSINEYVDNYVKISSPLGIMAMYACIKADELNKREFPLNTFLDDGNLVAYWGGFLVATTSAGLIQVFIDFNTSSIKVLGCTEIIKHYVYGWISKSNLNQVVGLKELKEKIDLYFSESNKSEDTTEHK